MLFEGSQQMVVVADDFQVDSQRLMAVNAQRRAAKKAPSALCANQSRNTRRGERQVSPST
jgi:hypothetical protein